MSVNFIFPVLYVNILEIINFKLTSEEVRLTSSIILIRLSIDVLSSAIYGRPLDITTNFKNRVLYTEIIKDKFNQTFNGINFQYKTKTGKELVHH